MAGSTVTFTWNGTDYTLEFDRDSVARAEKAFDLSLDDLASGKISTMTALFYAGFLKHHPNIKRGTVDQMWAKLTHKSELFTTLSEMYLEVVNDTFAEPEEGDEGNALKWSVVK